MSDKPTIPGAHFKKLATLKVAPLSTTAGGAKTTSPARFKATSTSSLFNKTHKKRVGRLLSTLNKTKKMGGSNLNYSSRGSIVKTTKHQFDASKDLK